MQRLPCVCALLLLWAFSTVSGLAADPKDSAASEAPRFTSADWPWWRGPSRNGIAAADQKLPRKWSSSENILWKAPVPGRGHGSTIVMGNQVFLAAADPEREVQSLLCFDRKTGERQWEKVIHTGSFPKNGNVKSSFASSTPACDGERVFINFLHDGAIYTTCLTRAGKQLWQTKITPYTLHQGFASSPAIYESLVIVSADNKGGTGLLAGLERTTGKIVWKRERPKLPNYTSPIILNIGGRDQLLFTGCVLVTSLDPLTGKQLWEIPGSTEECVTSTVTDGKLIFTSGGYPKNHVSAIQADGTPAVVWENNSRVYVPSMLVKDGYLYAVLDDGFAVCWKCDSGDEVWKHRLNGAYTSSPVLVGGLIYATNETGHTYIFKATPDAFSIVAENQLGDEVYATPTICGGCIYTRVAEKTDGKRQEVLYCIGANE